jgi:hypothetical protein
VLDAKILAVPPLLPKLWEPALAGTVWLEALRVWLFQPFVLAASLKML